MITRIKMNILSFMFLMIFGISLSATTKQSNAQETIIIGSARTQTIEVNMESLNQSIQSGQPQDRHAPAKYVLSDQIKKLPKKIAEKPISASFKNSKVVADESKFKASRHTTNRSKSNSQNGKMPLVAKKKEDQASSHKDDTAHFGERIKTRL